MKKYRKLLALLMALSMLFVLASCSSSSGTTDDSSSTASASTDDSSTDDSGSGEALTIAYSAVAGNDLAPWSGKIWDTLQSLCEERGWTFVGQSAAGDAAAQPEQIETMLNTYDIDYFVIFAGDLDGIVDSTELIAEQGIPVIMAALGASDDTYVTCTVGPDQEAMCAQLAADLIEANGADAGLNIVQISGVPVQQDYILREAGFQNYITENSNYNFLGDVAYAYSNRADAKTFMQDFLNTYGDEIDVLMCYDDDLTMGALQAIDEAGKTGQIQVYSITGQVEAMEAIEAGSMTETVLNRGAGIAEGCIEVIEALEAGETVEKTLETEIVFITADNVAEYKDQAEF